MQNFSIIGQIWDIRTIAVGHGIRELALLNRRYGKGRWRKIRALPKSNSMMVQSAQPRFIGTKLTELGSEK